MNTPKRIKTYRLLSRFQPKQGRAFKRSISIPSTDTVLISSDAGNIIEEFIAYERSMPVFVRQWNKDILEVKQSPPRKINWSNNVYMHVDPVKEAKLAQYMDLCNYNASNKNRDTKVTAIFEEVNPEETAKKNIHDDKDEIMAKAAAYDGDIEKLREVMVLIGYSRRNIHGELWTESEVRDQARIAAEQDPSVFLDLWGDSSISYRININKALALNIITIDNNTAEVKWADNGNPVMMGKIPVGVAVVDHLVKFVNNGGKGKTFYDEMLARVLGGQKTADEISMKFKGAINDAVEAMTPEQLANKAMEMGIIVRKAPYLYVDGMDGKSGRICKSKDDLILSIKNNVEINGVELATLIKTKIKVATA